MLDNPAHWRGHYSGTPERAAGATAFQLQRSHPLLLATQRRGRGGRSPVRSPWRPHHPRDADQPVSRAALPGGRRRQGSGTTAGPVHRGRRCRARSLLCRRRGIPKALTVQPSGRPQCYRGTSPRTTARLKSGPARTRSRRIHNGISCSMARHAVRSPRSRTAVQPKE